MVLCGSGISAFIYLLELELISFLFSNPGIRFAPIKDNGPDMVLIYDVNGFIAGMNSVVLKKYMTADWIPSDSKWYRHDIIFGEEAYLTTAYFVDPSLICKGKDTLKSLFRGHNYQK